MNAPISFSCQYNLMFKVRSGKPEAVTIGPIKILEPGVLDCIG